MASNQVALILGVGPRVGTAVAQSLASKGYKVAVTSRKGTGSKDANGFVSLKADFSDPKSIPTLFRDVETHLGSAPSVVVYNAAGMTPPPDKDNMLSIPADRFAADLTINTISPYVAAQECVKAWETLPKDTKKTFIYTGNVLNRAVLPVPIMVTLGVGKSASAYWIGVTDAIYSARGYRFFYADERHADGKMKGMDLDGPAHGEFYAQLAEHPANVPWDATFVKGKGYVKA